MTLPSSFLFEELNWPLEMRFLIYGTGKKFRE